MINENWRPPEWKNPHKHECSDLYCTTNYSLKDQRQAYEAGASAMVLPAYQQGQRDRERDILGWIRDNEVDNWQQHSGPTADELQTWLEAQG